jgi:hypothetical protein
LDSRNLFVIGPDGRITFKQVPVNVLSQEQYAELGRAIAQTLTVGAAGK